MSIASLVAHLAKSSPLHEHQWQGWHIRPISSGNNLLFRASGDDSDLAVKFFIRDERNRAQREFASLSLMDRLGLTIGPRPVYLDLDSNPYAVLVQTWIEGSVLRSPPDDDSIWIRVLQAYWRIHQVQPLDAEGLGIELSPMINHIPCDRAIQTIHQFALQIPEKFRTDALYGLLKRLNQLHIPQVGQSSCWCHGDASIRNIIITTNGIGLVDWEYSGIADPAEELAKLMTHPFAIATSEARWQWVAEKYAQLSKERDMLLRVQVNYALRLAWWCVRLLFGYHVLLRRETHRLAGPGAEEEISTLENIERYFSRTYNSLASIPHR